jgi:hypothetical protein
LQFEREIKFGGKLYIKISSDVKVIISNRVRTVRSDQISPVQKAETTRYSLQTYIYLWRKAYLFTYLLTYLVTYLLISVRDWIHELKT